MLCYLFAISACACSTPHPKLLIWPSSARGTSLHTRSTSLTLLSSLRIKGLTRRSTSLTLSFSLRVKGLTRRCYVWNNKDYKLALTLLNFQCGTKHTNNNHICTTWATRGPTSPLLQATNGMGCCPGPPLGTPLHGHVQQELMLRPPFGTPLHVTGTCSKS
jgi:hypothetical protein